MNRPRVLFVDDEPALRTSTKLVLESFGYEVVTAEDGIAALEMIQADKPDVIISDLKMPRMDGAQFLSIARAKCPDIPLIALTGEFTVMSPPRDLVCDAFFEKAQHTVAELRDTIQQLITLRRTVENSSAGSLASDY